MISVTYEINGIPGITPCIPRFSFFEQSVIEIPAPQKYEWAQAEKRWIQRDCGPEWFLSNELWAHKFYMMKRPWWVSIV